MVLSPQKWSELGCAALQCRLSFHAPPFLEGADLPVRCLVREDENRCFRSSEHSKIDVSKRRDIDERCCRISGSGVQLRFPDLRVLDLRAVELSVLDLRVLDLRDAELRVPELRRSRSFRYSELSISMLSSSELSILRAFDLSALETPRVSKTPVSHLR